MPSWANVETSMPPPAGHAVPARAEELSVEWLTACLKHTGALAADTQVAGFEVERIGQGRGFAGQLMRVSLRYEPQDGEGPRTLIAKFASDHTPTLEMMAWMNGYQREVRFYRDLSPGLGVSTPRCFFAHYDAAQGRFCLLLEDLAPAASVDLEQGLTVEQAKLVLEQLAMLHARWWNRAGEVDWALLTDDFMRTIRDRFLASVPRFTQHYAQKYPKLAHVAKQLAELLSDDVLLNRPRKPPLTLAHNDLHLENVFLPTASGGRFALIDWQGISASRHGTNDVTRILSVGMTPELRREHGDALLAYYHTHLRKLGVRGFSLRQLRRRFREEMASMVMIGVMAFDTLDFDVEGGRRTAETLGARIEEALGDAHVSIRLALVLPFYRAWRFLKRLFS